jgi:signal transduction histidine kinase
MCMSTPAEAHLRRRLAELARSHRSSVARELAAIIAHEINTPLGAILTNVETMQALLQSPAPDLAELRTIAADVERDSQRAADVVRHLRNLLKKSELELELVDLSEPVRDAVYFYAALAATPPDHIASDIAPVPLPVKGNAVLLHQVVLSLIANAVDAMSALPADQRRLEIATARTGDGAEVSVADTGPGIQPDRLEEIFVPFFSTKALGLGLGLSMVRTIVEAHDGRVWAENRPGGGAAFRIRLPLAQG